MPGGLQKTPVRILLTVMTAAMMVLIFCFSMETAEKSDQTSGALTKTVISVAYPEYKQYTPIRQKSLYDQVQHIVRKSAHFTEYTLLGLLMRLCLESWFGRRKGLVPISWGSGTLYAVTDEIHQLLIDGRSGQWTDVLLDSSGVLTGVLISTVVLWLLRRHRERRRIQAA